MEAKLEAISDVVDTLPNQQVDIQYMSAASVKLGNTLTTYQVKDEPFVRWPTEEGQFYTMTMIDPDAPEDARSIKHWLLMNIPGTEIMRGESLASYKGAGTGPQTDKSKGKRRYIFLVYKQSGKLVHTETKVKDIGDGRIKFNVNEFAKKYNLGAPIAANYFVVKYD